MATRAMPIVTLSETVLGQEADLFLLLSAKEDLTTKTGKPYLKVTFRDSKSEVSFPIWSDAAWYEAAKAQWTVGGFYRVRGAMRETNFGPQLEIRKIREVNDADKADGFDPAMCLPQSKFDPREMFAELLRIAKDNIEDKQIRKLTESILQKYQKEWLTFPAARHNHHAYAGGLLEHTLSVTRTAMFLAAKYAAYYDDMTPPLNKSVAVAGAILHDVGKFRELACSPEGAVYSAEGAMIGHMLLGRDIVRETAAELKIESEALFRLEHAVIAHQRLPEWGSPKPPMTPEALLIHYADDMDAKMNMMATILREDRQAGPITSKKNVLAQHVYRGEA